MNGPKVSDIVALEKFGYMLENPRISEYCLYRSSDNLWSADNQQERPTRSQSGVGILRETTRQTLETSSKDMVRTVWRHAECGRDDRATALQGGVTTSSEIPCRVSSDPHEWRNDLSAVSTRGSAKLNWP
jgi:hypothetical protein